MTSLHEAVAAPSTELPAAVDVVVVGAGHNGLVCAGYLAAAGLEVAVLEAGPTAGGNTRTEELTLPGFAHDSCSSAHVLLQSNPLIRDDELGLQGRYGLEYILTDPAAVFPQPDGDPLVLHRDLEATCAEVARFSRSDAAALRGMITEWRTDLAPVHGRWSSGLELGTTEAARRYLELRQRSAWDVVHSRFTSPVVRSAVLWLAMATIQDPRRPGTGFLPASLTAGRISFGWATPRGGSQALPDALVRQLRDHGGDVYCEAPVSRIETTQGRATAVVTDDGRRVAARRAIVSSAHLARLAEMLEEPGEDLLKARKSWRPGLSVFAVHAALKADLTFPSTSGAVRSPAAAYGSCEGMVRQVDAHHRGVEDASDPWLLVVDQTVVDPGRAPAGQATFKILTIAPYDLADGREWGTVKEEYAAAIVARVAARCDGLAADDILAIRAESPVDVAHHNPHNLGGSCHGGEFVTDDGGVIPGWLSYSTSVPGLFLTGATAHPGGSVSGRPGRNAARRVLEELGLEPGQVMGPQ